MAKKKHKGHYCKICGEYKSNESFSGKGHVQHICKECMGEMKKSNKKILDLPFGDNEFEIVDADEYIDNILYGNNEERENKTFKKLSREQKIVLKAIVQDEVTFYWQAHRQIPVNDKLKQLRSSVNTVVYEQLDFAIKDDTMFKAYIQEQVITVINKILRQEKEQNKEQQQQQQQQQSSMTKQNAQQILDALMQDEKNTMENKKRQNPRNQKSAEKNW